MLRHKSWLARVLGAAFFAATGVAAAQHQRIAITGIDADLGPTPVLISLDASLGFKVGDYLLREIDGPARIPGTVFKDAGNQWLALVVDKLPAGRSRSFRLGDKIATGDNDGIIISVPDE